MKNFKYYIAVNPLLAGSNDLRTVLDCQCVYGVEAPPANTNDRSWIVWPCLAPIGERVDVLKECFHRLAAVKIPCFATRYTY